MSPLRTRRSPLQGRHSHSPAPPPATSACHSRASTPPPARERQPNSLKMTLGPPWNAPFIAPARRAKSTKAIAKVSFCQQRSFARTDPSCHMPLIKRTTCRRGALAKGHPTPAVPSREVPSFVLADPNCHVIGNGLVPSHPGLCNFLGSISWGPCEAESKRIRAPADLPWLDPRHQVRLQASAAERARGRGGLAAVTLPSTRAKAPFTSPRLHHRMSSHRVAAARQPLVPMPSPGSDSTARRRSGWFARDASAARLLPRSSLC